jgi:tetratricopeptide (TPR) repeat protein
MVETSKLGPLALLLAALPIAGPPLPCLAEEARLGRVSLPNSGSPSAQEPFLLGLAALHSFFYDEAAEAFAAAQRLDPGFALAYWGEALTYNHPIWQEVDLEAARGVLGRLGKTQEERSAKAATPKEKGYLAAAELLFGGGDKDERDRAYSQAMRRLYEQNPDDHEAAALYALSLQGLQRPGPLDTSLQMRSGAVLEEVLAANPQHPGAAHYLIHAYDDPVHAPLGLRAARAYAAIAPAAHHALHMPSHIFVQLGMWEEAAASNRTAWEASVGWADRRGLPVGKRDFHSLSWLHYAQLQLGRVRDAEATVAIARQNASAAGPGRVADALAMMEARHAVETGSLATARRGSEEDSPVHACASPGMGAESPAAAALFARGAAAARAGDVAAVEEAVSAFSGLSTQGDDYRSRGLKVMELELGALARLAAGRGEEALPLLSQAAALEEALGPPSGPPHPVKPAHELYGEVLLELGKAAEARVQFERSLQRTPDRAASLLGAARAAARMGDGSGAREHYARLLTLWRGADADLPALAEARGLLADGAGIRPAS